MGKRSKSNTKQSVSHESKRQRRGVVAYPEVPHESCPITSMFRLAFAAFLINTATATQEPSFLSIRGTHKWSLSLHLCMKAREFSALLIGCNFVDVIRTVKLNTDNLDDFVDRYIQRGSLPSKSICEVARRNKIYINALKDRAKGKVRDGPYSQMVLLRIGGYDESVTSIRPTLQINDCTEPPPFHTSIRTAQRKLTNAIRGDHFRDIYMGDDIDHVVKWLEMSDVLEGKDNKNKKMAPPPPPSKPNNSTANDNNDPTPIKPPSSLNEITPGTSTKTKSLAPTSNIGGDKDPVATQLRMSDDNKLHISNESQRLMEQLVAQLKADNPGCNIMPTVPTSIESSPPVAAAAAARVGHPNNHTLNEENKKKFNLLATLAYDVMSAPTPNVTIDAPAYNRETLLRQLTSCMYGHDEPISYETTNSSYRHTFCKVTTKKFDDSYLNLKQGMKELFGVSQHGLVMEHVLDYCYNKHEIEMKKALREMKLIPKKMSVYETAVMMDEAGILGTNLRKLTQCMVCFMGLDKRLMADENELRELGKHCVVPVCDVYEHPTTDKDNCLMEKIRWWYKNPQEMYVRSLQSLVDGIEDFDPNKVKWIYACHGGDHARKDVGKFRMVAKCIMNYNGTIIEDSYSIADVECRKDSAAILKNTIMPAVVDGMNAITTGKVIFHCEEQSTRIELVAEVGDESTGVVIRPKTFLAGDIAFLAAMLGREGYEGWWCMWCWLMKPDWFHGVCKHDQPLYKSCTEDGCTHHQGLDIQEIIHQCEENDAKRAQGTARKGVAMRPMLNKNTIVLAPGLHLMMGIAEMLISYFFDKIDEHVEPLERHELATRESIPKNEALLEEEEATLRIWKDSVNGGMKLKELNRDSKKLKRKIENAADNASPEDIEKKTDVDERIKALQMVQDGYENNIKTLKAAIKSAKDEWKAVRDEHKLDKTSIFNKCEAILKTYRISRAAYHGGKFTGTDIIKMMNNAVEIFDEMKQVMLTEGRAKDGTDKDKEIITEFCTNTRDGLQLWNDIFARMSNLKADMNDDYCNETQKRIDAAMAFMRKLEFSITPKLHAVECHVVYQMRTVEGFPYMLEQWIEQYHQKGHRMDTQWHGQSWEHQSMLRSGKEHTLQLPESKKAAAKIGEYFGVKTRKRDERVVAKENKIKEERKDGYQFSLGNSFWIHPLVELSFHPSILLHGIRYLLVAVSFGGD